MTTPLDTALAFTLPAEGGYVDNPNDSGGATNHGITQATYDRYRLSTGDLNQSVKLISNDEVGAIYSSMYWIPAHCNEMALKLSVCHFDWSVNHGVQGAIITLQDVLGITGDGVFGPQTRSAMLSEDTTYIVTNYLNVRRQWYKNRVIQEPSQSEFLDGWLKRVDDLQAYLEGIG